MPTSQFVDISELAERLHVSRTTLKRWNRNGYIPNGIRVGPRLLRWERKEIDKWIEAGCPRTEGEITDEVKGFANAAGLVAELKDVSAMNLKEFP